MRFAVLGAGAVGQLAAWRLSSAGHSMTLVSPRSWGRIASSNDVFKVTRRDGSVSEHSLHVAPDLATALGNAPHGSSPSASSLPSPDALLLCTKSYQTLPALRLPHSPHPIPPSTALILLQNGLGAHEALRAAYPHHVVILGTTTNGAYLTAPNHVAHSGQGETYFGVLPRATHVDKHEQATLDHVITSFAQSEFGAAPDASILSRLWCKLGVNCCVNALTALLGCRNGALEMLSADADPLIDAISDEVARVARSAGGVDLAAADVRDFTRRTVASTRANWSSMAVDMKRGGGTECDDISGFVVAKGKEVGVEVPVNETLWRLLRCKQALGGKEEK